MVFQNENLKDIQEALEKAEKYYKSLLDEAPIIYVIYDEAYEIQWYNDHLLELVKTDQPIKKFDTLILPEHQNTLYFHVKEVMDKGVATDKIIIKDQGGQLHNILIKSNLQDNSDGLRIRSALMDQTEEEKSKKDLLDQKLFKNSLRWLRLSILCGQSLDI